MFSFFSKQKDDLEQRFADLKHKMEIEIKTREEIEKVSQRKCRTNFKKKNDLVPYKWKFLQ